MTKTESRIIRSILTSGRYTAFKVKDFAKANEVLTEIMLGGFTIEDMSDYYGVEFCWTFKRNKS